MGWRGFDQFLEENRSTWATAPLSARDGVLERQADVHLRDGYFHGRTDSPAAIAQRRARLRRTLRP